MENDNDNDNDNNIDDDTNFNQLMNNEINRFNRMKLQKQRVAKAVINQEEDILNINRQR